MPLEILGARTYDVADLADPHGNQATVRQLAHSDREIDMMFQQIERPIFEHQLDIDIRILLKERCNDRYDM